MKRDRPRGMDLPSSCSCEDNRKRDLFRGVVFRAQPGAEGGATGVNRIFSEFLKCCSRETRRWKRARSDDVFLDSSHSNWRKSLREPFHELSGERGFG